MEATPPASHLTLRTQLGDLEGVAVKGQGASSRPWDGKLEGTVRAVRDALRAEPRHVVDKAPVGGVVTF